MIELYEFELSGNCHKVRLLLSLLGLPYTSHLLKGAEREQKSAAYLAINPFGLVPVLKDGEVVIRDSQAILVYLARAYGNQSLFPDSPAQAAEVVAWLSTAANEVARGPNDLRLHYKFGRKIDLEVATSVTENLLRILNARLAHHEWLATTDMTIADIAVYPYIALANEGKVDLEPFNHIENWLKRIEALPGFVAMPGILLKNTQF
ncbi:MAG: glutathione S-transferase [Gammaproteobacteria bacterium]|nr:MAG: glutathione S-transferase [Gammaproteobacteria bacterium]